METLEELNKQFLKVALEVSEYMNYLKIEEACLNQPIHTVDLNTLSKSREYLNQHKSTIKEKIEWTENEWQTLTQSRIFQYECLGKMLVSLLTKQEGKPYYYATRLVKHTFQIDEANRPFYKIISFITENKKDLEPLLLETVSPTMHLYYINNSPIMRPLPEELKNVVMFEKMIKNELEARKASELYVVTDNIVSAPIHLKTPEYQSFLTHFPFSYVNQFIETLIVKRYQKNAEKLTEEEILKIINEFCECQKQGLKVVI